MTTPLDIQGVGCIPFFAQALLFGVITDRAITLLAVFSVVGMALGAMGLLRVKVTKRSAVLKGVLARRYGSQVLRVYAGSVPAGVIDHEAAFDIAIHGEEGDAMSAPVFSTEEECSVSVAVKRSLPDMASPNLFKLRVESCLLMLSQIAHKMLLKVQMDRRVEYTTFRPSINRWDK
jgi:hypothetical protein